MLRSGVQDCVHIEVASNDVGKNAVRLIAVRVQCDTVIARREVELRKEKTFLALAIIKSAGYKKFEIIVEPVSVAEPFLVGIPTATLGRNFQAFEIPAALGDHVDDGGKGTRTVNCGTRFANDFDAIDQINIYGKLRPDIGTIENVVILAMAIDEKEDSRVVVPGAGKAPNADIRIISIIDNIESTHSCEHIRQRSIPVLVNFLARDNSYGSRGVPHVLDKLRGSINRFNLDVHQILDGQLFQIFLRLLLRPDCACA